MRVVTFPTWVVLLHLISFLFWYFVFIFRFLAIIIIIIIVVVVVVVINRLQLNKKTARVL